MTDTKTAVYRLYGAYGALLYVGVAKNPDVRLRRHELSKSWWPQVAARTIEWHPSRLAALQAEANAIKSEGPLHNIAIPDPSDPMTWPAPDWSERQAEGRRRARTAKATSPPCPDCGQALPPIITCARPSCGKTFYKRSGRAARAIYCSRLCARAEAQAALRARKRKEGGQ